MRGLDARTSGVTVEDDLLTPQIAVFSSGDARAAYNTLEAAVSAATDGVVTREVVEDAIQRKDPAVRQVRRAALQLDLRAPQVRARIPIPTRLLYWLARILESGEDSEIRRATRN